MIAIKLKDLWKDKRLLSYNGGIIYLTESNYLENWNPYCLDEKLSANRIDNNGNRTRSIYDFSVSKYYDYNSERFLKPNRIVYVHSIN